MGQRNAHVMHRMFAAHVLSLVGASRQGELLSAIASWIQPSREELSINHHFVHDIADAISR
jgi:hypothetical protein